MLNYFVVNNSYFFKFSSTRTIVKEPCLLDFEFYKKQISNRLF